MTNREFFAKVITLTTDKEMVEFANKAIKALDEKNAKASDKRKEKAQADAPLMATMVDYLGSHKKALGNELATALGVSTPKAIALAKKLVDNGTLDEADVKIVGVGHRKAYSLHKE